MSFLSVFSSQTEEPQPVGSGVGVLEKKGNCMSENELYESLVGFGKADSFLSLEPTD